MNKIIILLFILVLLSLFFFNIRSVEKFFSNKINYLDSDESKKKIDDITTFNLYTKLDRKYRNIDSDKSLKSHYKSKLEDWTSTEKQLLKWILDDMKTRIDKNYRFIFSGINISKYRNSVENGFPHTNSDTIFLTSNFVNQLLPFYNIKDTNGAIRLIGSIIIHECIHIWQRKEPTFFDELYDLWNFKFVNKIHNYNKLSKRSRYNPDGLELKWVFNDKIIPIAVYRDDAKHIGDVDLIGIYCEKIGGEYSIPVFPKTEYLSDIDEFTNMFGYLGSNIYHPNELSAELISKHIVDLIFNETTYSSPALDKYKKLFKNKDSYKKDLDNIVFEGTDESYEDESYEGNSN